MMTQYTFSYSGSIGADCTGDPTVCSAANTVCGTSSNLCECDAGFVANVDNSACVGKLMVKLLML